MNVTPLFVDHLSPLELRRQQDETMLQARRWLTPAQLAALLLNRSMDDIAPAIAELLHAAQDLIDCIIEAEEADAEDRQILIALNAQKALAKLVDHFGVETICDLARKYETPNNAA